MKTLMKNRKTVLRGWVSGILMLLTFALLAGCAANSGRLAVNHEVTNAFRQARVLPDYNYYFSGREYQPRAILGIHKDYRLGEGLLWRRVKLTQGKLAAWISQINSSDMANFRSGYRGYSIYDAEGREIGVWYSAVDWTTIKKGTGNEVFVYTPSRDPNEGLQGQDHSLY